MSGKKRVSVFARLGPAGPHSPEEAVSGHRRYSTDKHVEKAHHSHPREAHTHSHSSSIRDEGGRDRKLSTHQDYPEKKQLSYREPQPSPTSASSQPRLYKPYHMNPEAAEGGQDDIAEHARLDKRLSLPLPSMRKSRDLKDRISPTGKDYVKHMLSQESKSSKVGRALRGGGGAGGGGGGGGGGTGKRKRKRGSSDNLEESEEEVGEEEGKRKRSRVEKKTKAESGQVDEGRRQSKYSLGSDKSDKNNTLCSWPDSPISSTVVTLDSTPMENKEGRGKGERVREERERGREERGREERGREERGREERGREKEERRRDDRDHRRKREDEWTEQRSVERKRKREASECDMTPPPSEPTKLPRNSDYVVTKETAEQSVRLPEHVTSSRDGRAIRESEGGGERKRRELEMKEPTSRRPRSSVSESGSSSRGRYSRLEGENIGEIKKIDRPKERERERERKERGVEHMGAGEGEGVAIEEGEAEGGGGGRDGVRKLDWNTISSLSGPKPKAQTSTALNRFTPGAIFAKIGVSHLLAGPELYASVCSAVTRYLTTSQSSPSSSWSPPHVPSPPQNPFGDCEFAMSGVSKLCSEEEEKRVCVSIGPCRRALTASADFTMRRKLRKFSKELLPPTSSSSSSWNSDHYASAVSLYHSLGTKASGRPAFRLEPSLVGSVLVPK